MAQITCQNLSLGYDGRILLSGLSFSVRAGDYCCIVGENGAGKTTLMKALLGLLSPAGGSITAGDGLKKEEIGYMPQQTSFQRDFPASVREIVLSGCQSRCGFRPYYGRAEKARAADAMEKMGIRHLAGRCYRELSGGQQQRVLLARALCAASRMLLLDEPVSGLDPRAAGDMYRLIDGLNKRDGLTVLMISHDIKTAVTYASHILHIGPSCFFGTMGEYLKHDAGKQVGGGIC